MTEEAIKASDLFVRCLEAEGVRTIFGVPGEENANIMMSLLDSSIEFVICRQEQGAAFMAEVHGRHPHRASGRRRQGIHPRAASARAGPGAAALAVALAQAFHCGALRVGEAGGLLPALDAAFEDRDRPMVIVVPVDYSENMKLTRRLGELISH